MNTDCTRGPVWHVCVKHGRGTAGLRWRWSVWASPQRVADGAAPGEEVMDRAEGRTLAAQLWAEAQAGVAVPALRVSVLWLSEPLHTDCYLLPCLPPRT